MLDVRRLRVLREVAAHGSFSAAAFEMIYTPSAVSQQIAALEREAGVVLVERSSRGIRLTQAGELVLRHAEAVLDRLELAEEELRLLQGVQTGRLRLGCFHSGASTLVPYAVAAFRDQHPQVEVSLVDAHPSAALERLSEGTIDLALVFNYDILTIADADEVRLVRLLEEPVRLVLPHKHRLAKRRTLCLADLEDEAWIQTVTPSCSKFLATAAEKAGFLPNIAFETDNYHAVLNLVAAGVGVALVPSMALGVPPPRVAVRSLGDEAPVRYVEAALPQNSTAAAEAMLAMLEEAAREHGEANLRQPAPA